MDARLYMIVDLEKQGEKRFITEQVVTIHKRSDGLWNVCFATSNHRFNYHSSRLLYLTQPETIDLGKKGLYVKNKRIGNITELLCFSDGRHFFYRVTYNNGRYECFDGREVYVTRTPIDQNCDSVWEYIRTLASETGLENGKGVNLLARQFAMVDVKRDNVPLAQYLGNKSALNTYRMPRQIYYPFGCNASQTAAVKAALTNQVSIIQGPPGTGKTQTILNIVANLLMAGKTILVVSNNNSAVENVAEKLEEENLDFMVAKLGNSQNLGTFIAHQPDYPDRTDWELERVGDIRKKTSELFHKVSQGFNAQTRQAELKAECEALTIEMKYNDKLKQSVGHQEWLWEKKSSKLLKLLNLYQIQVERKGQRPNLLFRLKSALILGTRMFSFLMEKPMQVIACLETAYYKSRKSEIEQEMKTTETILQSIDILQNVKELRSSSLQILKHTIAKRYTLSEKRRKFLLSEVRNNSEEFLKEYPVVLSTTYSSKNCISQDMVFDYVIMDEASQVDITTGALALSCAVNAVIVGDDKQLPNIVSREGALALNAILSNYTVEDKYNPITHSFLQSCAKVLREAPVTLLREHYRCHPKIIEFCNQQFYDGRLIAMTEDKKEHRVLKVVRTTPGNHARRTINEEGRAVVFNQREIETILQEVMPEYTEEQSVGIITPYADQAQRINKALGRSIASTVHKYQGRECDTIIISTVDNTPTEFSDNANLLNVAISRAKTHLCLVVSGNEIPEETNLSKLIAYIQYNNFEVKESGIHSVFDLLYQQYTSERLAYMASQPMVSEYLSENLIYNVLVEAIERLDLSNVQIVCHYPLSKLIANKERLDEREKAFVESAFSHVDFLIYNSLTKHPLCALEVDGWQFHAMSEAQQSRDMLKNQIFTKYELELYRISTTDTVNTDSMEALLKRLLQTD